MKIDFESFSQNYRQLTIDGKYIGNFVEDLLEVIGRFEFTKKHEVFYPQGIFNDKELNLIFVTKNAITVIEVGNSSKITTWKNEEISSCTLTIPSIYDAQLQINLKGGTVISLDNVKDTNVNWKNRLKEEILKIYSVLTSK
ncbi:hypothetical protein COE08_21505 [Priestia megaterium]|uniref:hypothetical protein n=1 Tax=Priestia megaterium TaxID=1404 RepID=UPI000BFCAF35|nr:hypothetical protein [Priestia megaterium]PGX17459.1 hypothetical protein COE08_21505 [Priestia megaterium]